MPVLPYGAIEAVNCERIAIILPSSVYEEGEYPEAIVAHHIDGLTATPVRLGIEYVPKDALKAERETCHDTNESPLRFVCSECGGISAEIAPNYCPSCGMRVIG